MKLQIRSKFGTLHAKVSAPDLYHFVCSQFLYHRMMKQIQFQNHLNYPLENSLVTQYYNPDWQYLGGHAIPDESVSKPYALKTGVNAKKLIVSENQEWYKF